MNKSVKGVSKNLRGKITRNIIGDLNAPETAKAAVESQGPGARSAVFDQESIIRFLEAKRAKAKNESTDAGKQTPKTSRRSVEAQNARISWMNDIVNAAVSLKGMGASAPSEWQSRKTLAGKTNAELWALRGEATRKASEAQAKNKGKKAPAVPTGKAALMKGSGEKTTVESGKVRIKGGIKAVNEAEGKAPRAVLVTSFEQAKRYSMGTLWCLNQERFYNAYAKAFNLVFLAGNGRRAMARVPKEGLFFAEIFDEKDRKLSLEEALSMTGVTEEQFKAAQSGGTEDVSAVPATESAKPTVIRASSYDDLKISKDKGKAVMTGFKKKDLEVGDAVKFSVGEGADKVVYLAEVTKFDEKAAKLSVEILEEYDSKAAKEAVEKTSKKDAGLSLSVCPLCGSAAFDATEKKCPVCKESYKKYRAVEAAEYPWGEDDEDFTTIDIDGEEQVLIDDEGQTSVINPSELEGQLVEHTHELVIDDEEDPIFLDTGTAVSPSNGEQADEFTDDVEPIEGIEIAFVKIPLGLEECLDLLQEDNEDSIEVVPTETGYEVIVSLEADDSAEEIEDEDLEAAVESDDMDFEDEPAEIDDFDDEVEENKIVITLEELAEGTVIHAEDIMDVAELIGLINQLMPARAEIVEAEEEMDEEKVIESDMDEMKEGDESDVAGDDMLEGGEDAETKEIEEDLRKLAGESLMPKRKISRSYRVTETGTMKAMRNGKEITVKVKSVYETKFPKVTKAVIKKSGKVPAVGAQGAKALANTLEAAKTRHEFMKAGVEALGSALNTRKLLLSLWDAMKANKGSSKTLANTLEAAMKAAQPKAEKKMAKGDFKKVKKLENKRVKKLDRVVKFGGHK